MTSKTLCGWLIWILMGASFVAAQDAPSETAAEASPAGAADRFLQMLERESEPLAPKALRSEDGAFQARVPGTAVSPIRRTDGVYVMGFDFGAGLENQITCYLYTDPVDFAGTIIYLSELAFDLIQTNHGEITSTIYGIDAGGIDSWPYLGADWIYKTVAGNLAGQAKFLIAKKREQTLACMGTFTGYDDSYFNFFKHFVATLEFSSDAGGGETYVEPYYQVLLLTRTRSQVIGIGDLRHTLKNGTVVVQETTSSLFPIPEGKVLAMDVVTLESSTADGVLIQKTKAKAIDGELESRLQFRPSGDGSGWRVEGVLEGEEYTAVMDGPAPSSDVQMRRDLHEFFKTAKAGDEFLFHEWMPTTDPSIISPRVVKYERPHGEDAFYTELKDGESTNAALIHRNTSILALEGNLFDIERIFIQGDPVLEKTAETAASSDSKD